jgi:hypothetical protein
MSLLQKASIITTPTAYAEDYLYSIKPAIPFGEELVINGNFYSNSDWNLDSGWSISGGKLIATNTALEATQTNVFTTNKTYEITFTIDSISSGSVKIKAGTTSGTIRTTAGTYTQALTVSSGTSLVFDMHSSGSCVIDNVSAKEVTDADFDFDRNSTGTRVNEDYLIETVATNTPRIDYTNGEPSILLEPSRTNLITYSQDFSQWSTISASATDDYATSPEGITNASRFLTTSTGAYLYLSSISVSNSTEYTISVYAKSNGNNLDDFRIYTSLGDSSTLTATSQWQRFTYTFTTSTTSINVGFRPSSTQNADIQVFGYQLEQGSYATSLIHTSGSTVTRSADVANNAGNSDLINSTEGVLYAEIKALADDSTYRQITLSDGTITNRIGIFYQNTSNQIGVESSGTGTNLGIYNQNLTITNVNKIALKYKANDCALWINGTQVATDTSFTAFSSGTLSQINFDKGDGSSDFYGNVKSVMVFKEALTDLELEKLTGYNNHELYMNYYNRLSYLGLAEEYNVESDINNYIL